MKDLVKQIRAQTLTLMVAALGFVAALVWKDAISAWLAPLYADAGGEVGLTIAALIVTAIVVIVTIILTKFLGEEEKKK
jgi:uncharacterized membrane protein